MDIAKEIKEAEKRGEERIVAAAIRQDGLFYVVNRPRRHHDAQVAMAKAGIKIPITGQQGFLTSLGRFVGRGEAVHIAEAAGQIIEKTGPDNELFSEDLW